MNIEETIDEYLKDWFPYWKQPVSPDDWNKLVSQRRSFAEAACRRYDSEKRLEAPLFLRQLLAKSRYRTCRKYVRTKRRAEREIADMCKKLLHVLVLKFKN